LGDGFYFFPVFIKHGFGLGVGLVDDAFGFFVDDACGLIGVVFVGDVALGAVLAGVVDEAESWGHAPLKDHGSCEAGDLLNVTRCA